MTDHYNHYKIHEDVRMKQDSRRNMPMTLILSVTISFAGGIVGAGGYTVVGHPALFLTFISVVIGTILLRSRWSYLVVPFAVAGGVALGTLFILPIPGLFFTLTGMGFILYDSLVTVGGIFMTLRFLSRRDGLSVPK